MPPVHPVPTPMVSIIIVYYTYMYFQLTVAGRPTAPGASMTRAPSPVEEESNGGKGHVHVTIRLLNMAA